MKKWRIFNTYAENSSMKQYHLIFTKKEKVEDAFMEFGKYSLPFNQIQGYCIQSEALVGVSDSNNLLGMKWE